MPAEWEKHSSVWLAWPYDQISFPELAETEKTYLKLIHTLIESEKINLIVLGQDMENYARVLIGQDGDKINFFHTDYADVWTRDYGPMFIVNKIEQQLAIVKWEFNAWGNKYSELLKDNLVAVEINKKISLPFFETHLVLEGGSIDVNGVGSALTTKQCLLNPNRNNINKSLMEQNLEYYLGIHNVIWLEAGIAGDDTDGHVDDVARFVNENTIVCAYTENSNDRDYIVLNKNYEILAKAVDQVGKKFNIVKLPKPQVNGKATSTFPASYTNFYISNEVVIVPTFAVDTDLEVLEILQKLFPHRKVVGIDANALVCGCGTFHCITQQQPIV